MVLGGVMSDVKSKNLYELLGNEAEEDSDREAPAPTKTVDRPVARSGKRDAPKSAPTEPAGGSRGGRGARRGDLGGNEAGTISQLDVLPVSVGELFDGHCAKIC